jgi:hypothetical protein
MRKPVVSSPIPVGVQSVVMNRVSVELKGRNTNNSASQHEQCRIDFVLEQDQKRANGDGCSIETCNGTSGKRKATC